MNSPKHSCARESQVVVKLATVQSSLLIVATIILVTTTAIAQDPVTFHAKPASQSLVPSINFVDEANALGRSHRWREAVDIYLKALQLDPNNASAQNNLGHAYVELGRLDDAAKCLESAVRLQPSNALLRYNLGNIYLLAQQVPQAIRRAGFGRRQGSGLERPADLALRQRDLFDLALPQQRQELAHRNLDRPGRHQPPLDHEEDGQRDEQVEERELRLLLDGEFHFRLKNHASGRP